MPVRKFRSVSDMPQAPLCPPLDPANIALACDLSELATRLRPRRFPAGVYRYPSIEAASLARDAWERAGRDEPAASGEATLSA
jgi:hypothetical protein